LHGTNIFDTLYCLPNICMMENIEAGEAIEERECPETWANSPFAWYERSWHHPLSAQYVYCECVQRMYVSDA